MEFKTPLKKLAAAADNVFKTARLNRTQKENMG